MKYEIHVESLNMLPNSKCDDMDDAIMLHIQAVMEYLRRLAPYATLNVSQHISDFLAEGASIIVSMEFTERDYLIHKLSSGKRFNELTVHAAIHKSNMLTVASVKPMDGASNVFMQEHGNVGEQ